MSAMTRQGTNAPTHETFDDELDAHIAESMLDPEFRAASEDVAHRFDLLRVLVGLRKKRGLTQKQVAERMGVGQSTVAGFETEGSDPRLSTVQRYARAVETRAVVTIQTAAVCDWIKPSRYADSAVVLSTHVNHGPSSKTARDWAKRADFATAA